MKKSIDIYNFRNEFELYNRVNNFSYEGLNALFNYLEEWEDDAGCEIELDVIALCCEYTEYDSFEELQYSYDVKSMDDLMNRTVVIMVDDNSFIIQDF